MDKTALAPSITGTCRLCLNFGELRRSHIIPNALFKRIKQRDAGKGIRFDDSKESLVEHTSESWWEYLLCDGCEQRIGLFDKYAVETLRNAHKSGTRRSDGVLIADLDYARLKRFFTSLLWRAAISTLPEFDKVRLPEANAEGLRKSLLSDLALPPRRLACRIELLYDPTPALQNGFSGDNLGQLIPSPQARVRSGRTSFIFLVNGYLVEIFAPDAPHREWRRLGMLKDELKLFIPARNIFAVPELKRLLVAGYGKHAEGRVSESIKRRG